MHKLRLVLYFFPWTQRTGRGGKRKGRIMERTKGKTAVRGKAGYAGFGINDSTGRSLFAIPSNGTRPVAERQANAEFAVRAWNNHDALVAALTEAMIAMKLNGAPDEVIKKMAGVIADAIA